MKFFFNIILLLVCCSGVLQAQESLFNRFINSFDKMKVPFAIDENYMSSRYDNPDKFKQMDPIFFEFIFDEKDKQRILATCGGYGDIKEKLHHVFIGRPAISSKFHSVVYAETLIDETGDNTTYYLNTYSLDGNLISRTALAKFENIGTSAVSEGYIFGLENIFKINKVYKNPESIQSLSKMKLKINNRGKVTEHQVSG